MLEKKKIFPVGLFFSSFFCIRYMEAIPELLHRFFNDANFDNYKVAPFSAGF